jgi:HEPN domain-containing protein
MSEYVKTLILNDLRRMCLKQIERNIYIVEIKTAWISKHYILAGIPDSVVKVSWREIYRELGKCVRRIKKGKVVIFCGCLV